MNADLNTARRALQLLVSPGSVFELRAIVSERDREWVEFGYFDAIDPAVRVLPNLARRSVGVYMTLNPVRPELWSRAANRTRRAGKGDTTGNQHIVRRTRLLIDVDGTPVAGVSSTDDEHKRSCELASRIARELEAEGWPRGLVGDSGNGAHVVLGIDLPAEDDGLVKRVLEAAHHRWGSAELKIDTQNHNAGRITKLFGTPTRKGDNTPVRPHRVSCILSAPPQLEVVPQELLERLANTAPPVSAGSSPTSPRTARPGGRLRGQEFLRFFIAKHGIEHEPERRFELAGKPGTIWVLAICPFDSDHARGEAEVHVLDDGTLGFSCKHQSCKGKGWREFKRHFEPEEPARRDRPRPTPADHRTSDREPPPEVLYEDPAYAAAVRADIEAYGDRDNQPDEQHNLAEPQANDSRPDASRPVPTRRKWWRAPELPAEILRYADVPWVSLALGDDEIVRVRHGGTVVVMGGSGSGKSSLVSGLLVQHAANVGPAIALSIELPADEMAGRIVGMRCDASWEEALRGLVRREFMEDALNLPRLWIIERDDATLTTLEESIIAAREEFPNQPILVAIDYAQLVESKERDIRQQVTDVFKRIDRLLRRQRVVGIAISQMSRIAAKQARDGEKIGAESADGGAESAAIERFATFTLTIGAASEERSDGSRAVELSVGKGRMFGGDRVIPMTSWGRSGRWRVAGTSQVAAEVRELRDTERAARYQQSLEHALLGAAMKAPAPVVREELAEMVQGKSKAKRSGIACLIARGDLVEVAQRRPRSRSWLVWTPERAADADLKLVRDMEDNR